MTETTNPSPSDPAGPTAPTGSFEDGQSLLDAAAVEQEETPRAPAAGVAGESDLLSPQDTADPSTRSAGRGEGAS